MTMIVVDGVLNFQRIRREWFTAVACWAAYSEGKADLALSILDEAESMLDGATGQYERFDVSEVNSCPKTRLGAERIPRNGNPANGSVRKWAN